jgi:hypothetical protein
VDLRLPFVFVMFDEAPAAEASSESPRTKAARRKEGDHLAGELVRRLYQELMIGAPPCSETR